MQVGLGHKGKLSARAVCKGIGGHSAIAPLLLNAIHLASDVVAAIRLEQLELNAHGRRDDAYDVAYSTIHAGIIAGGTALNVVADTATVDFEIRHLAEDDPAGLLGRLEARVEALMAPYRAQFPAASIDIEVLNAYPGFAIPLTAPVVAVLGTWLPSVETTKVSFGTEAGLYVAALDVPTVVIGPGSMDQGHKPNEFIDVAQLHACDAFLDGLLASLN